MIEQKQVKNLVDIFEIVPKTVLSNAISMNPKTLGRKAENVGLFTVDELKALAHVFQVDFIDMVKFITGAK